MERNRWWLAGVSVVLVLVSTLLLVSSFSATSLVNQGGSLWEMLGAVGTFGATIVALWLAIRGMRKERDAVARLVSASAFIEFKPSREAEAYEQFGEVHIANESAEPIFDVRVSVLIGQDSISLGPLSVPTPLAVVPQRRTLTFDITMPLRAHENTWNPRVELWFSDPKGRRWRRDGDGKLFDVSQVRSQWIDAPGDKRQLGADSVDNPMFVARLFLELMRADSFNLRELEVTLAPEAAWEGVDWATVRDEFESYNPTSMVDYPAPFIARVKLNGNHALEGKTLEGEGVILGEMRFLTLTYSPGRGWRVWGIGYSAKADQILFPEGTFHRELGG